MSMTISSPDTLTRLTNNLKANLHRNEKARSLAAKALQEHVTFTTRALSGQDLTKFNMEVNSIIRSFIQSPDVDDKLCSVLVIDALIGIEDEVDTAQEARIANYLRQLFPADIQVMTLAARALGKLAQQRGAYTADFVEFELSRSIEWLADRQESRRHASVLILAQLAQHASVIAYPHVGSILENVWGAFRENKQDIREAAADMLGVLLILIAGRDSPSKQGWYTKIDDEARHGLRIGTTEAIHGSLLIYRELLRHAGMFMDERFRPVCHIVLRCKDHREGLIRRTVIGLIPALAAYNPQDFIASYLDQSVVHLLGQMHLDKEKSLAKEQERSAAFMALGGVALVVKQDMAGYLDVVIARIKDGLRAKSKQRTAISIAPIMSCISMLAMAVGPLMSPHMSELLDLMLDTGLSEAMCQSLSVLATCIPPLLPIIQERLLNILSIFLSGQEYRAPGAPQRRKEQGANGSSPMQAHDTDSIILALSTLGSFNFMGHVLNEFVRDCCLVYLDHDNPGVRRAAAQTSCQLFARDPICFQTSLHAVQVVGQVLEKLLLVGIADPEASIRQTVLASLDERFDRHLAKAENVRSLFIALNDESFSVRELSMGIIGRVVGLNPAYVVPSLRKLLIQLLTEIEYSGVGRSKEESARLLRLLVSASEDLVRPYMETILQVLLPNIRDSGPGVVSSVLEALGVMARVGGEELLPYMDQLMPVFIDILQDQSSPTKRSAALKALGDLASNTGYVIEPYVKYPILLDILMGIIKTEQSVRIRQETMKLVGVLGALDPYRHKQMVMESSDPNEAEGSDSKDVVLLMSGVDPSSDEYYPTVVITALLKILRDPSLSQQYQPATQAILNIFQALQMKMVPFLPQIMPVYLHIMQSGTLHNLDFYFEKMGFLVSIVKLHIRPYIPDLLRLVKDNWHHTRLQERIIGLTESIAISLDGEFKVHIPQLLRSMLSILDTDVTPRKGPSLRVLQALVRLGGILEEYMHLIVPVLVKTFEKVENGFNLRRAAISTLGALSRRIEVADYASRIVHPLARILAIPTGSSGAAGANVGGVMELKVAAMDTLCWVVLQIKQDYLNFMPLIQKIMVREKIHHTNYDLVISKLLAREPLPTLSELTGLGDDRHVMLMTDVPQAESDHRKLPVNPNSLRKAWDTRTRSTKEDWTDWIRRLSLEMLKETPSHSLRACADMANSFQPLAKELFNAAFMSCWTSLTEQFQEELAMSIKMALEAPNNSPEVIQTLLNVAEFMEHDDKPLPIEIRTLGKYAFGCHAFAKALHYKELEFITDPSTDNIERLISINNQLQQTDAATGILTFAQLHHEIELKEAWYERLHRWEDALAGYERKQLEHPEDLDLAVRRMRCLHNLGEWDALSALAQVSWGKAPALIRQNMAPFAAAASWGLGQWELLDEYISVMQAQSPDRAFFKAILALHRNQFSKAEENIDQTRMLLDTELTALVSESYSRAYTTVVRVQMMAELEEIISYKRYEGQIGRQQTIRKTWMKRLLGCERNVEIWQRVIKVHAIALEPAEDMVARIKFTNLCRKAGRLRLAEQSLISLIGVETAKKPFFDQVQVTPPQVIYAKLKYMWAAGIRKETLRYLRDFTSRLAFDMGLGGMEDGTEAPFTAAAFGVDISNGVQVLETMFSPLLARCFLKQGEWQLATYDGWNAKSMENVLTIDNMLLPFHYSTQLDTKWYKGWHTWALANFDVISYYERSNAPGAKEEALKYVNSSITGFFRSIALSAGNSLQDTLRLLTLWFKYGHRSDVSRALQAGFPDVNIDTWLQVIPQLIARIHAPSQNVHRLIHQLLADVGRVHPQALVYSLTVASKSPSKFRTNAALAIIEKMRAHSALLVEQALLVQTELIRVAILWHEMWREGLEQASTHYYSGGRNIDEMLAQLEPLHEMIQKRPETLHEVSFSKAFGRDLKEAYDCCKRYRQRHDVNELNHAWDIYIQVFDKIKKLPQPPVLELPYVSPLLLGARDLELAIPGTYKSGNEAIVRISSFSPTLSVMTSKQKPRRLSIFGSDGKEYQFLLKGHEDLRQDERVMQLFGLCNTLLQADPETFKRHLSIQQFSVTPLSPNSGLIGWVPQTDTLHNLIREYRESRKLSFYIESQLLTQMAPDGPPGRNGAPGQAGGGYDLLTVLEKVECFENMQAQTSGQDLYKILWLKSKNSEVWLERRTTYTRSLAVMSMVGHVLGLGDRHPSNIMMERQSGRVVHIDFGDCFEVAMHRPQFPERIPFRLTRMLVQAMEVSGIEGSFRNTSEEVMRVLRENKESVMAVLEAFVHDPLINWRILQTSPRTQPKETPTTGKGTAAATTRAGPNKGGPAVLAESFSKDQSRSLRRVLPSEQVLLEENGEQNQPEQLNQRALTVLNRVTNKLTGRDFNREVSLDVKSQVEKLIQQATSVENLCQCWIGYCAFW